MSDKPSDELLNQFILLLDEVDNTCFECGNHKGNIDGYDELCVKSEEARSSCIKWVEKHLCCIGLN